MDCGNTQLVSSTQQAVNQQSSVPQTVTQTQQPPSAQQCMPIMAPFP